jgi:hypothetical protein
MASNKSEISVTELDFDLIKGKLIEYFKADPTFQDYEFEGSALNIILDILSYNTHMNAVMANMAANEMFIDSAQLRSSVVSLAKAIGYTPRSKRTATAEIDIYFPSVSGFPAYITIDAGTRFVTPNGMIFSTKEQLLAYPKVDGLSGEYLIEEVDIYEGVYNSFKYTVDNSISQNFVVPSNDADITSLKVRNISGNVVTEYTRNENITLVNSTSNVYFIHERADGRFEVTFGDGIIGKKPISGSTVELSYIISKHGEEANNAAIFQKTQMIDGINVYTITTRVVAYGAADPESIDSIRDKAPKMYKAQSRAVTTADYENFMLAEYPWIESMSIWGGEYNEPPVYGKVFIAIKPKHTEILSNSLKESIKKNLTEKYNVVTVIPEIVSPDYLYILVNTAVQYNVGITILKPNEISILVDSSIAKYFVDTTQLFNRPLHYSKLSSAIDASTPSISNSITSLKMMKRITPKLGVLETREMKFSNPIVPGSLYTSYYNLLGTSGATSKQIIRDDGLGNLYSTNILTNEIVFQSVGSIDYATGAIDHTITVYDLPLDTLDLRFYCTPSNLNITPGYNQIILLDKSPAIVDYGRAQGVTIQVTAENKDYK